MIGISLGAVGTAIEQGEKKNHMIAMQHSCLYMSFVVVSSFLEFSASAAPESAAPTSTRQHKQVFDRGSLSLFITGVISLQIAFDDSQTAQSCS